MDASEVVPSLSRRVGTFFVGMNIKWRWPWSGCAPAGFAKGFDARGAVVIVSDYAG
jgi:hypothetical protein